jgi:hypothetical protein
MRCNEEISADLVPLLLELRQLPEAVRLHIADILISRSDASIASWDGEQQYSPSCTTFLMLGDVDWGDFQDLNQWIESLEDEFEPMLGGAEKEWEDSNIPVLGHEISDPQHREGPRLDMGFKGHGLVLDNTLKEVTTDVETENFQVPDRDFTESFEDWLDGNPIQVPSLPRYPTSDENASARPVKINHDHCAEENLAGHAEERLRERRLNELYSSAWWEGTTCTTSSSSVVRAERACERDKLDQRGISSMSSATEKIKDLRDAKVDVTNYGVRGSLIGVEREGSWVNSSSVNPMTREEPWHTGLLSAEAAC